MTGYSLVFSGLLSASQLGTLQHRGVLFMLCCREDVEKPGPFMAEIQKVFGCFLKWLL